MSSRKSLTIVFDEKQHFACRDCPARCCTSSWGIPVSAEEFERIAGDDEARVRMGERGLAILRAGVLPMREKNEHLACVFLDEDMLCSLHRRHGHEFIPASCQAYPFGFSENEKKQPVALMSRYCPSIRDDYGEPVAQVVREKLQQVGGTHPMAERMGLRSGRALPRVQYVQIVRKWVELLQRSENLPATLAQLYDFTEAVDAALPKRKELNDKEFLRALARGDEVSAPQLAARNLGFNGKVLLSHLLGGICYPTRVMLAHRLTRVTFWEKVRSWGNRLSFLFGWGRVKPLFVERPVPVRRIGMVHPFLTAQQSAEFSRRVRDYLVEVLERRQGMSKKTYLHRVLVDLALMTSLISRYARAHAAAEGRTQVTELGVKEGIGIAELLFSHQGDAGQGVVLQQLRLKLLMNPDDYRRLLAAEL